MDYNTIRKELLVRTAKYIREVDDLYDSALKKVARLFVDVDIDETEPFSFDRYGKFQQVDEIMTTLEKRIQSIVEEGIKKEFAKSYRNIDELIDEVVKGEVSERIVKRLSPKITSNVAAKTYIKATASGNITASTKVWNGAVLGQMESAVHDAMLEGMPAARMATHIKQFLEQPDEFFRRYRIKVGEDASGKSMYGRKWKKRITLPDGSHKWKDADPRDYPSGKGVYHSSYKNALRYASTSTNIAYRTGDYQRYQDLPFVIGIEIKTSQTNHNVSDICDELKGKYPKDFKWTGWHPNCRCYQVPILAKQSEVDEMVDDILDGGDGTNVKCDGVVTKLPSNFKDWVLNNVSRLIQSEKAGTTPYFIRDNLGAELSKTIQRAKNALRNYNSFYSEISALSSMAKRNGLDFDDSDLSYFFNGKKKLRDLIDRMLNTSTLGKSEKLLSQLGSDVAGYVSKLDPNNISDLDIVGLVRVINNSDKAYFLGKTADVLITKFDYFMAVLGDRSELHISNYTFSDINNFNPLEDLKGAIKAILKNEKPTFNQEYAIESLNHELKHSVTKGYSSEIYKDENDNCMEAMNQFCSRIDYGKLMRKLGTKPSHYKDVMTDGFGYSDSIKNLRYVLDNKGISYKEAYAYINDALLNYPYDVSKQLLEQFFIGQGVLDSTAKMICDMIARDHDIFVKSLRTLL